MNVKSILKLAITFLDKKELLDDSVFLDSVPVNYVANDERTKDIEKFLLCLNLVYGEIARDYMPLITKEEITFTDEQFQYTSLQKVLLDIVSLKSQIGRNVKYKMYPTYISAKIDKATLEYSYEPDSLSLQSSIESYSGRIPLRVFAYGVAMEYSFLCSQSTEALIWEERYKNALLNITRKKSEVVLPCRRWI